MIYFFHRREAIRDELSGRTFLQWYEDKIWQAARKQDYREIYRLLYDMADYIYDKRFDQGAGDRELTGFLGNTGSESEIRKDDRNRDAAPDEWIHHHRIDGLKKILTMADTWMPDWIDNPEDGLLMVLYYLTKGVICLRISQCYMNNYDYENSDLYGKDSQELLWHGKQIISRVIAEQNQNGIYSDESELYIRAVKLNLAKFHRNYARKNRRSDYDAAMDVYRHICSKIQNRHYINETVISSSWTQEESAALSPEQKHDKNKEWFLRLEEPLQRQFALIWMDAIADIAFVHRCRNQIELAHKETICFYTRLREILLRGGTPDDPNPYRNAASDFWKNADRLIRLDKEYWRHASGKAERVSGESLFWYDEENSSELLEKELLKEQDYLNLSLDFDLYMEKGLIRGNDETVANPMNAYDVRRFFLLTLNELTQIRCDLHRSGYYTASAVTAGLADLWAFDMDGPFYDNEIHHSIDAVNYLSIAMRKYFKFRLPSEKSETELCENMRFAEERFLDAEYLTFCPPVRGGMTEEQTAAEELNPKLAEQRHREIQQLRWIRRVLNLLNNYAGGNYLSRSEILKWYTLGLELRSSFGRRILGMIDFQTQIVDHFPEITHTVSDKENIQSLFLCGMLFHRLQAYRKAIRYFDLILKHTEADYIRVRSLGIKTQYLKSSSLIALGRYKEAQEILLELRNKLKFAFQSKSAVPDAPPAPDWYQDQDERVESSLGYCFIKRGKFREAWEIFDRMYFREPSVDERSDRYENRRMNPKRQIWQWNNLAACCIFLGEDSYRGKDYTPESLLNRAEEIQGAKNRETEYLRGLYSIVCSARNSQEERLTEALEHFALACDWKNGITSQLALMPEQYRKYRIRIERNEDEHRQKVEAFSAYLINLVDLCRITSCSLPSGRDFEKSKYVSKIKGVLLSLPESMELSMKAAIAVSEWLIYYQKKAMDGKKELVAQLFRSFSYLKIFEERGARVFNELKVDRTFRFFGPEQRGEILAQLLILYQPIKAIKEASCYTIEDQTEEMHLCHYASMDTLKQLLAHTEGSTGPSGSQKGQNHRKNRAGGRISGDTVQVPYLRASNCGYMNDVNEGNVFLSKIRHMYNNADFRKKIRSGDLDSVSERRTADPGTEENRISGIRWKKWNDFMQQYYPQQKRSSDYMIPSASDVYVASLSVHRDSFPLWTIYGDDEKGCNIEFSEEFFDIAGPAFYPEGLRKYIMSRYTDEDFPLYKVSYLKPDGENKSLPSENDFMRGNYAQAADDQAWEDEWEILSREQLYEQGCGTKVINISSLNRCIENLTAKWVRFDQFLDSLYNFRNAGMTDAMNASGIKDPRDSIRSFAAHRLDEIRFLFKDSDYTYEAEVRTVYTVSSMADARTKAQIDLSQETPRVYIDIERELKDLTVTLGSRIEDRTVDKYVTWLKQTRRVNCVRLAKRNRYAAAMKQ